MTLRAHEGAVRGREPAVRRRIRKRGILQATLGHLLLLAGILGLDWFGVSRVPITGWLGTLGFTLLLQFGLWYMVHRGWDARLSWDPHFLYLPVLAAAVLFTIYIHLAPEARAFLLMAWFVALLYTTGQAGFWQVIALALFMTACYLGVVVHLVLDHRLEVSLGLEAVQATVFLVINVYAASVFEELRRKRRETRELRNRLARQAVTDPLTGLPNRRYLEEFLEAELARIRRYGGACSLAMIDVDNFKNYNDTLGHMAGDRVLQGLAEVFRQESRVSDVVARYGGEEFGLIMVNTTPEEAVEAGERLREAIERHEFKQEDIQPGGNLTVSIGIASYPEDGATYEELVRKADQALYRAKRAGKNRVHVGT